ncbi:MAG TPA: hypothetical protein VG711_07435, partial [Phycisphaerales bacterium]|nr:hypothetical protein [Phycisphaerales bacterium]
MNRWSEKLRALPRIAIVCAWFFAVGSLIPLLLLAFNLDGAHSSHVFGTTIGERTITIPGLTYSGVLGSLLLWTEICALIAA